LSAVRPPNRTVTFVSSSAFSGDAVAITGPPREAP
jgi:hypothetical protein